MKHDVKPFIYQGTGDQSYYFAPNQNDKQVLVLNNIFRKTNEIGISKAFIELVGAFTATNLTVYWDKTGALTDYSNLEGNENVVKLDYTTDIGGCARFDVTKVIATLLKEDDLQRNERYIITGNGISTTAISCSITVYYDYKRGFRERNATLPFELKNANGSVDLSDGSVRMSFVVNNGFGRIPATVKYYYDSNLATEIDKIYLDNGEFEQINYRTGKGWKTNYHQFVVAEKSEEFMSDGQSVGFFTWVNAQGNHIIFSEKYYANIGGAKKYLTPSQVIENEDGTLSFTQNGISYAVTHEYYCRQLFKLKEIAVSSTQKKIEITDLTDNKITFEQTETATHSGVVVYRLKKIEDSFLNAVNVSYNANGWLSQISSVGGNTVQFEYDEDTDMLYKVKDMLSDSSYIETVTITDGDFNLSDIITPENHRNLYLNYCAESNLIETVLDAKGNGYYFIYCDGKTESIHNVAKYKGIVDGEFVPIPSNDTKNVITVDNVRYKNVDMYEMDYNDRYTRLTEMRNGTWKSYLFDYFGNNITAYENNYDGEGEGNPQGKSFANVQQNLNISNQNVFKTDDLTIGASYSIAPFTDDIDAVGTIEQRGTLLDFDSRLNAKTSSNKGIYKANAGERSSITLQLSSEKISAIKNGAPNNYIVSAWAMAKSLPIEGKAVGYNYENCEAELKYNTFEESAKLNDSLEDYRKNRQFSLATTIVYEDDSEDVTNEYSASFDADNTNFQQLQIPVRIRKALKQKIKSITISLNFQNNDGDFYLYGASMKPGSYNLGQYNNNKMPIYSRSAENENYYTEYYYGTNNLPSDVHTYEEDNQTDEYTVEYEYDNARKSLLKTTDSKNFVEEKVYNDYGDLIKTKKYRLNVSPEYEFIEESTFDLTTGDELTKKSPLGLTAVTKTYNHGALATKKPAGSDTVALAYDEALNLVKTMTVQTDPPQVVASNTYFHNETLVNSDEGSHYAYDYDGFGRVTSIKIDGEAYCTIEYTNQNQKVVTYANGEKEKAVTDNDDKEFSVYCTDRNGNGGGNTAIEMKLSSYGTFKDLVDEISGGAKYKTEYDECGRPYKSVVDNKEDSFYDVIIKRKYDQNGKVQGGIVEHINSDIDETNYTYEPGLKGKLTDVAHTAIGNEKQSYDNYDRTSSLYKAGVGLRKDVLYLDDEELNRATNLIACEEFFANSVFEESYNYSYDALSRLTQVRKNTIIYKKYTYDGLGRLVREDNRDLNKTFVFAYDNAGNILSREEYNFTIGETLPTTPDSIYTYSYDSSNKNHLTDYKIEINGENPITESVGSYEIGNPWTYRGKSATWKNVHRLASYDGITFDYNYAGIRTKKTVNGVTTKYAINDNNIIAEQKGTDASSRITYFYGLDGVTAFKYANAVYYYKKNFLGDIIGIYDSSKQLVAKYVYDAWGNHKIFALIDGAFVDVTEHIITAETTPNEKTALINPFRYRSYYFDTETGFYYLQSRYYDPEVGRFISMDSIEYLAPETINGLNLYAYCLNNPVMGYDPEGTWNWETFWKITGAVVAAVAVAAIVVATGGSALALVGGVILGGAIGANIATVIESNVYVSNNNVEAMSKEDLAKHNINDENTLGLSRNEKLAYIRYLRENDEKIADNWTEAQMLREFEYHDRGYYLSVLLGSDPENENSVAHRLKKVDFEEKQGFKSYAFRFVGNLLFW